MPRIDYRLVTEGRVDDFAKLPRGAEVVEIDGKVVLAKCEGCDRYILEGEEIVRDGDGLPNCATCPRPPR